MSGCALCCVLWIGHADKAVTCDMWRVDRRFVVHALGDNPTLTIVEYERLTLSWRVDDAMTARESMWAAWFSAHCFLTSL